MATFEQAEPHLRALWALLTEEPAPVPEPEPEPTPEPIPSPIAAALVKATTGGEWDRGVSLQTARFLLADTQANIDAFVPGNTVLFANGESRTITSVTVAYGNVYVSVSGSLLDPALVGNPNYAEAYASSIQPQPEPTPGLLPMVGMNIAGLGNNPFLDVINGHTSVAGTHYRKPEQGTLVNFVSGLNGAPWIARLPIAGERLVTTPGGALRAGYLAEIVEALDLVHSYGGKAVIDLHNYFRWWKKVDSKAVAGRDYQEFHNHLGDGIAMWTVIGEPDCPMSVAHLADLWQRLALALKDHPALLAYGLMNEPHNRGTDGVDVHAKWPAAAQACIGAIRAVDVNAYITVGGNAYSSAKNWPSVSDALKNLVDSADKLLYEAHQYTDQGGNGGGRWADVNDPVSADQAVNDFAVFVDWLKLNGKKGYVGEFGGPATAGDQNLAVANLFAFLKANRIPATQWLSGPGFSDSYANGLNKADGTLKPNAAPLMAVIGETTDQYGPL